MSSAHDLPCDAQPSTDRGEIAGSPRAAMSPGRWPSPTGQLQARQIRAWGGSVCTYPLWTSVVSGLTSSTSSNTSRLQRRSGFDAVAVNDHMVFGVPWLDGPTALASVVSCSGEAQLFTTVANPVRGPVALAKALAALDVISDGRVVAGLGPGTSERDYASVGHAFDERWPRFDESVKAIRALLRVESFGGRFYEITAPLEPRPTRPDGPPL